MNSGLYIQPKNRLSIAAILLWCVVGALVLGGGFVGYRFYAYGDLLPEQLPIAAARPDVREEPISASQKAQHHVPTEHPRYLSIPSIGVEESRVLPIGVKETGELDTPSSIFDTGWYQKSATPGDNTSALLLDGHNGGPAKDGVFKKLPALSIDEDIIIERGDGEVFAYTVKQVKVVGLEELNSGGMNDLSTSFEPSVQGLNIISCTGKWVPAKGTYDKRVVVRAVLQEK